MNRKRIVLALITAIMLVPSICDAQIKGLLRDRAVEALRGKQEEERKVVREQEQPEPEPERRKSSSPNFMERKMMSAMGLNNVKHEKQYNFSSSMAMEIETVDAERNREKILYTTFFNPDNKSYAMVFDAVNRETGSKEKSTMIFDMTNFAMIIISEKDGERNGMAISIKPDESEDDLTSESNLDEKPTDELYPEDFVHPLYKPTGRSKTISGFGCDEYKYTNEEGEVELWVAKDKQFNISQAYGHMNGLQALASGGLAWGMGMVMEMVFNDISSGTSTHMLVKEVQPNSPKTLDISGYQIIGVGAGQ